VYLISQSQNKTDLEYLFANAIKVFAVKVVMNEMCAQPKKQMDINFLLKMNAEFSLAVFWTLFGIAQPAEN
jgi:hypothetical protein